MVNVFRSASGSLFVLGLDEMENRLAAPTAVVNLTDNYRNALNYTTSTDHSQDWIELDLGGNFVITSVNLQSHVDQDLNGAIVTFFDALGDEIYAFEPITGALQGQSLELIPPFAFNAHSVRIDGAQTHGLELAGIDVFGAGAPDVADGENLTNNEFAELQAQVSDIVADFLAGSDEYTLGNEPLPGDRIGSDHFVFSVSNNFDVIEDFQPGDKIIVSSFTGSVQLVNGRAGEGEIGYSFEQLDGEEFTILRGNLDSDENEEFTVLIRGHHDLTGSNIG